MDIAGDMVGLTLGAALSSQRARIAIALAGAVALSPVRVHCSAGSEPVEATPARTCDEVAATKTMLNRTEACFDLKPKRLAAASTITAVDVDQVVEPITELHALVGLGRLSIGVQSGPARATRRRHNLRGDQLFEDD
jgi:hypothetical protein